MSLFSHLSRARKRAQAQKVIRKAVVETLESRRLLSITNFSFTGDSSVQEGHQAHFVLTADTNHDWTNPTLAVHIDFGVKDKNGVEETMDFSITPGQTNDIYGTFHEETNPANPAHVTCSVHDDGAFTYNVGPDDRMGDLFVNVDDASLIADAGIDVPCPETPDYYGNTVTPTPVTVGHFTDTASADSELSDFVAQIDWGDGTTSQGQIVLESGANYYRVVGSHAYQATDPSPDPAIGNWPITVTVTDLAPNGGFGSEGGASTTINSVAKVMRAVDYNLFGDGTKAGADGSLPAKFTGAVTVNLNSANSTQDFALFLENRAGQAVPLDLKTAVAKFVPANNTTPSGAKAGLLAPIKNGDLSVKFEISWNATTRPMSPGDVYTLVITGTNISTTITCTWK